MKGNPKVIKLSQSTTLDYQQAEMVLRFYEGNLEDCFEMCKLGAFLGYHSWDFFNYYHLFIKDIRTLAKQVYEKAKTEQTLHQQHNSSDSPKD